LLLRSAEIQLLFFRFVLGHHPKPLSLLAGVPLQGGAWDLNKFEAEGRAGHAQP
jgi:hypothetical protein